MAEQKQPVQPPANGASEEIEALRAQLESAQRERDEYLSLLQITRADFENYQKRASQSAAQERRYASSGLAFDLLPVLDNLERAIQASQQAGDKGSLVEGVAMVVGQFLDALRRHGITRIDALGKPFDPALHQAVTQIPTAERPANTVVMVDRKSTRLNS